MTEKYEKGVHARLTELECKKAIFDFVTDLAQFKEEELSSVLYKAGRQYPFNAAEIQAAKTALRNVLVTITNRLNALITSTNQIPDQITLEQDAGRLHFQGELFTVAAKPLHSSEFGNVFAAKSEDGQQLFVKIPRDLEDSNAAHAARTHFELQDSTFESKDASLPVMRGAIIDQYGRVVTIIDLDPVPDGDRAKALDKLESIHRAPDALEFRLSESTLELIERYEQIVLKPLSHASELEYRKAVFDFITNKQQFIERELPELLEGVHVAHRTPLVERAGENALRNVFIAITKQFSTHMTSESGKNKFMFEGRDFTVAATLLGHGGIGDVYLAESDDGQQLVVKIPNGRPGSEASACRAAKTHHELQGGTFNPKDCPVPVLRGVMTDESGRIITIMEWMEHGDLNHAFQNIKALRELFPDATDELDTVWRDLWRKAFKAVVELHKEGVVHGDIKPENFFVTSGNQVKIGDFDLTKRGKDRNYNRTNYGGTPQYSKLQDWLLGFEGDEGKLIDSFALGSAMKGALSSASPELGREILPFIGKMTKSTLPTAKPGSRPGTPEKGGTSTRQRQESLAPPVWGDSTPTRRDSTPTRRDSTPTKRDSTQVVFGSGRFTPKKLAEHPKGKALFDVKLSPELEAFERACLDFNPKNQTPESLGAIRTTLTKYKAWKSNAQSKAIDNLVIDANDPSLNGGIDLSSLESPNAVHAVNVRDVKAAKILCSLAAKHNRNHPGNKITPQSLEAHAKKLGPQDLTGRYLSNASIMLNALTMLSNPAMTFEKFIESAGQTFMVTNGQALLEHVIDLHNTSDPVNRIELEHIKQQLDQIDNALKEAHRNGTENGEETHRLVNLQWLLGEVALALKPTRKLNFRIELTPTRGARSATRSAPPRKSGAIPSSILYWASTAHARRRGVGPARSQALSFALIALGSLTSKRPGRSASSRSSC